MCRADHAAMGFELELPTPFGDPEPDVIKALERRWTARGPASSTPRRDEPSAGHTGRDTAPPTA